MKFINPVIEYLKRYKWGAYAFLKTKDILGKTPKIDMKFPELIALETSSLCNLSCAHCPPQMPEFKSSVRKHNMMDYELFERLMNEIDSYGERRIALHKDGEPLLNLKIKEMLKRVKANREHCVYLTTNAHPLTEELIGEILNARVDIVNFSLGAATPEFYKKVRGGNFEKALSNIEKFLAARGKTERKPRAIVQIIDLPEYKEMKNEIECFRKYWKGKNVEISIWEKLTWGEFEDNKKRNFRYPCHSLWDSFYVNSNGIATICCMDWRQELNLGDIRNSSIAEMWRGEELARLRRIHIERRESELPACKNCNYWRWLPMRLNYPI